MSSLELEMQGMPLELHNTRTPLFVRLKNPDGFRTSDIISLYMPGKLVIHSINLESTKCQMMISLKPITPLKANTDVTVYLQYGKVPSHSQYDVRITINQSAEETIYDTIINDNATIEIRIIDDQSLMIWNFTENNDHSKNNRIHFTFTYSGLMPDVIYEENRRTFDKLPARSAYDFSLRTMCAQCSYWDPINLSWENDGLVVSVIL